MGEITWIGNIVRVGSNTPRYMYSEGKQSIWFRTMKDKIEIAFLDKRKDTLFLNDDYKMQFKAIKRQIIKDYAPKKISRYVGM